MQIAGASVAVTGGCGFIGSHLVRRLLALGASRVVVLDGLRYGDASNLLEAQGQVELVRHELGTSAAAELGSALRGVDLVFHLAAEKHNQARDDAERVYRGNVLGTNALLEAAGRSGVRRIVFASSLYAYGRVRGAPFVETETPAPATHYGISKLAGEHMLGCWRAAYGGETVALRFMFVYGPRQLAGLGYRSVVVKTCDRLLAGEPPIVNGDGAQTFDYVHVDDAVDAAVVAMERAPSGELFNVGSGRGTRIDELVRAIVRASGRAVEPVAGPADETAGTVRVADVEKIARVLGFRARTPLEQGLAGVWSWARARAAG